MKEIARTESISNEKRDMRCQFNGCKIQGRFILQYVPLYQFQSHILRGISGTKDNSVN